MKSFAKLAKVTIFQALDKYSNFLTQNQAPFGRKEEELNLQVGYRVVHLLLDQGAGHAEMRTRDGSQ